MIHAQARGAVIAQHAAHEAVFKIIAHSSLNDPLDGDSGGIVGQEIRNIRDVVDGQRHGDKEHQAAGQGDGGAQPAFPAGDLPARVIPLPGGEGLQRAAVQAPEEQHRQPHSRVAARPFAGHGKAHEQPGQEQGNQRFSQGRAPVIHAHIIDHEHIGPQDEQHHEAVDGGDAGLGEVHEIHRHQEHGREGEDPPLGDQPGQQIHAGQHQYARQCPGETPAEGRHAKDADGKGDEHLAQGRMGGFVGIIGGIAPHGQIVLIACAGVIDFVKIGAVVPAGLAGEGILLVDQGLAVPADQGHGIHRLGLRIPKDDLVERKGDGLGFQLHIPADQQLRIAAVMAAAVIDVGFRNVLPFEAVALGDLGPIGIAPIFAVRAHPYGELLGAAVNAAQVQHIEGVVFPQIQHHLLIR